jgi:hypothetical protein
MKYKVMYHPPNRDVPPRDATEGLVFRTKRQAERWMDEFLIIAPTGGRFYEVMAVTA